VVKRRRTPRLLAIESEFPGANVMLRLLEPTGSCRETLREQVYSGSYDKPFVVDTETRRFLHFDFAAVQSAMELSNPGRLALAYTRKMMAFLLFNCTPARILLLGLGGGSLAKFCYANLPAASVTAVELNRDVIALRDEFSIPADDDRFRIVNADGAAYISELTRCKDVILADACDRSGLAAEIDSVEFYRMARGHLSSGGVFVINLCGDRSSIAAHLAKLRDAFDDELLSLPVRDDGNLIVFGFKERRPDLDWERIESGAPQLRRRFRLDFPRYARRIAQDSKLREARTAVSRPEIDGCDLSAHFLTRI
jgi:spermidine synthase